MKTLPMGSYVKGDSPIHKLDPFVKLLSFFFLLTAVILAKDVLGWSMMLLLTMLIIGLSGSTLRQALSGIAPLWIFFVIIFLMNACFYEGTSSIWSWAFIDITKEGLYQGILVVFRVAMAMVLANLLTATTSPLELTGSIETCLKPFGKLGLPVHTISLILGVALRFIPTFMEEAEMIKKAQIARGARFESKNFTERLTAYQPLVIPVFLSAFRKADELSLAMEARGYHPSRRQTIHKKRKFVTADYLAFALCLLPVILQIII